MEQNNQVNFVSVIGRKRESNVRPPLGQHYVLSHYPLIIIKKHRTESHLSNKNRREYINK